MIIFSMYLLVLVIKSAVFSASEGKKDHMILPFQCDASSSHESNYMCPYFNQHNFLKN